MWVKYLNLDNLSSIDSYEVGENYISVKFMDLLVYTYSYDSCGHDKVERMKKLAKSGKGLNSFINQYAKKLYI